MSFTPKGCINLSYPSPWIGYKWAQDAEEKGKGGPTSVEKAYHLYLLAQSSAHWHGLVQLPFETLSQYPYPTAISKGAKEPKRLCIKLSSA